MCRQDAEIISHPFLHCRVTRQLWNLFTILIGIRRAIQGRPSHMLTSWNNDGNPYQKEQNVKKYQFISFELTIYAYSCNCMDKRVLIFIKTNRKRKDLSIILWATWNILWIFAFDVDMWLWKIIYELNFFSFYSSSGFWNSSQCFDPKIKGLIRKMSLSTHFWYVQFWTKSKLRQICSIIHSWGANLNQSTNDKAMFGPKSK